MLVSLVENDDNEMNSHPRIALDTLPYRWSPEPKSLLLMRLVGRHHPFPRLKIPAYGLPAKLRWHLTSENSE